MRTCGLQRSIATLLIAPSLCAAQSTPLPPTHESASIGAASFPLDADITHRRELLRTRDRARAAGDLTAAATINARLNADAMTRAMAIHDAWMTRRNPTTGLFPQSPSIPEWNYRNTGADFFGFQFAIALDAGASSVPLLRQTLARERALNPAGASGGLCIAVNAATGVLLTQTPRERLFSTSEYLKDGLMPLYERHADPEVLSRMREVADAILADSNVQSRFGRIPSRDSEINGDVLQAFARLGFICGPQEGSKYLAMEGVLADAAIGQMLAHTGGVPVHFFDYATDRFPNGAVRLRDHGNETAVGLSEAFATAVALRSDPVWSERADRWAEPLAHMYDLLLSRGVNADGLLISQLEGGGARGQPFHQLEITDNEPCDNWGYLLAGAVLFTQAEQRHAKLPPERINAILAAVDRISLAVTKTDNLRWEGDNPDGFADTIESAIHIAAARPGRGGAGSGGGGGGGGGGVRDLLLAWADDQMPHLLRYQRADGFATGDYLDGNVIRTAMLYADMRSGGFRLSPFTAGAGVGMCVADSGEAIVVVIAGENPVRARLIPDHDRHRTELHLPWDWPRINSWPEWFGVESGDKQLDPGADVAVFPPATVELAPHQSVQFRAVDLHVKQWRAP